MTLQELLTDIQQNILPSGIPNTIDAAKMRQAIGNVARFFNPADGDAAFEGFIRHIIYEGQGLEAFESYFATRKSKKGEFALFYDDTFFKGLVFARQLEYTVATAPPASGSFTLSAAPFDGTAKSQVLDLTFGHFFAYVIKFHMADGFIRNAVVKYNGQEVGSAYDFDFSSGMFVIPFDRSFFGQHTITLEYDEFIASSTTTLNYTVRPFRESLGVHAGKYFYHIENSDMGDFLFEFIITQNATDAQLRERSTHTGEQPISSVTNLQPELNKRPRSDPSGVTGADQITNIISLTQAEYDAIQTPGPTTLYVIT